MLAPTLKSKIQSLRPNTFRLVPSPQLYRTQSTLTNNTPYWNHIPSWQDISHDEFVSYRWQLKNTVSDKHKLFQFLNQALPDKIGPTNNEQLQKIRTKDNFIEDAVAAIKLAPMAIRLTPHVLSLVDWNNPLDDPIRRQFLPLRSGIIPDHKHLELDSLHEEQDSPVPGLVHRYPGRALFLATSICPVYCRFCTRSYAVGGNTETVSKKPQKPSRTRWEVVFEHIANDESLEDIVVSGGDAYFLQPDHIREIGNRLLDIPHIKRVRFASKGLAVAPGRILDTSDPWTDSLIAVSNKGRDMGKQVCLHTHINHANEITWITRLAANKLFKHGVIVRNQSVLLKGVNNNFAALSSLIKGLSDINIQPYYVYQCDMVQGIEDLRTPLQEIIDLDKQLRGTLSGFMMPSFVVDLPGGGGKRLVSTYETYDQGIATYRAPGLPGTKGEMTYTYHDPKPVKTAVLEEFQQRQQQALERGETLEEFFAQPAARMPLPPRPSPSRPPQQDSPRPQPVSTDMPPELWAPTPESTYATYSRGM
ncbi:hypothetical protein ACJQWK_11189 [Exserohilum turcicum]|uniref:Radical SAM core domain-containing protein n=1 Tax=Exserohilum turcicum (strain 28A) TaxID=671987 RepID=R0KSK6_EXST2|nr:uncharacterized protein SETTUDRAFT_144842 [Exserohilum turcica Et28A]EOA90777.1 hypothetical protein SETTUDRAFT_144842 [Exserohilum turcica Et28A]